MWIGSWLFLSRSWFPALILIIPLDLLARHLVCPGLARPLTISYVTERAVLHLNLHQYRSFWLTFRYHTARRPKSGVYAEVICRKCAEKSTDERQSHLDTSTTPVCPLVPQYVH